MSIDITITKTALDALDAKLSFTSVGYNPICFESESSKKSMNIQVQDEQHMDGPSSSSSSSSSSLYASLLHIMAQALLQNDDNYDDDDDDDDDDDEVIDTDNTNPRRNKQRLLVKIKRQTPLINAGYATRVAIITNTIQRFVTCHQKTKNTTALNIILLGCGFDVIGLWIHSMSLSSSSSSSSNEKKKLKINTYEVDTYENAIKKGQALKYLSHPLSTLLPIHFILDHPSQEEVYFDIHPMAHEINNKILFQGFISMSESKNKSSSSSSSLENLSNYILFHSDLRNISSLHQGFQEAKLDVSLPTLVISELVFAYLGTQDTIDQLLTYISTNLCVCYDSMFTCYEPMGKIIIPQQEKEEKQKLDSSSMVISVLDGYTSDYFQHFLNKLNTNSSRNNNNNQKPIIKRDQVKVQVKEQSHGRFQCIGPNPVILCNRLRVCGFDGPVDCCNANQAAGSLGWKLQSQDIFDEYTALLMHLSCYAVVIACPSSQMKMKTFHSICPWTTTQRALHGSGIRRIQPFVTKMNKNNTSSIKNHVEFSISIISSTQEEVQVQRLFENTYTPWCDTYASIKKLVKSALKNDLSSVNEITDNSIYSKSSIDYSRIRDYYNNLDGAFWVATVDALHTHLRFQSDIHKDKEERKVIGFIGIRRAGTVKRNDITTSLQRYEILRLVVCDEWRQLGVGKALVSTALEFVRDRLDPDPKESAIIMATTPALLEDANLFYLSSGFELDYVVAQSNLMMNTYLRSVKSVL